MLDLVCIITTGGVILFSKIADKLPDLLTPTVSHILQARSAQSYFQYQPYQVRYIVDGMLGLIFIIAWKKAFIVQKVDQFLALLHKQWLKVHNKLIITNGVVKEVPNFSQGYQKVNSKWIQLIENIGKNRRKTAIQSKVTSQESSSSYQNRSQSPQSESSDLSDDKIKQNINRLKQRKQKKSQKPKSVKNTSEFKSSQKIKTKWGNSKLTLQQAQALNYSEIKKTEKISYIQQFLGDQQVQGFFQNQQQAARHRKPGLFSSILNKFKSYTGNLILTQKEIKPIISQLKQNLMQKNVAQKVARNILETVQKQLMNSKTKAFQTVQYAVRQSVKSAVQRVLSSGKQIDIVKQALKAKQKGLLYKIMFIGVNGVGKSTNLAKVGYMLKRQGFNIMLAACDNFRAGAVQQLKVHAKALQVDIYQRGYKQDVVSISLGAIRQANLKKIDVLLIDTAGRMQQKKPLMAQLGRLVNNAKPDLTLFIGQALVGNDAIDQLVKFNQALIRQSDSKKQIDGIILSKFDTVDKKVGAALTMVHTTGKPIVFVGVGQKYPHLRRLNVTTVTQALLN